MLVLFGFAESLFKATKSGEIKEGTKLVVKLMSIITACYIFIFQIPIAVIFFQGYMCEEDPDDVYVLDVPCNGAEHFILIAVSTIGLIVYLAFIVIERMLFSSRNYETDIPWGSLERKFDFLKLLLKLI